MAFFNYTARNQSGQKVLGTEEAEDADSLIIRLQARGLFITGVELKDAQVQKDKPLNTQKVIRKFGHRGVKEEDVTVFARQMSTLLGSGVPLLKSLNAISRQIDSKRFYNIIQQISIDVEGGFSLRDALAKHSRIFSLLWVNLVETGEVSGNLPLVLERLANYLEKRAAFKRKVVSAMVYPLILLSVALTAIAIFMLIIVPKFVQIFKGFDIELPFATRVLIFLSETLKEKFLLIFLSFGAIIFALRNFIKMPGGKEIFDRGILKIPGLKNFLMLSETERFTSTMSTLLESGVPILYGLEISGRSANSSVVQKIIKAIETNVKEGKSVVQPMDASGFFAPMVIQMVGIGEEIGELDKMFQRIAAFYAELLETKITRFTVLFEPLMIIFMGIVIGSMVISMFLPIFQIANIGTK